MKPNKFRLKVIDARFLMKIYCRNRISIEKDALFYISMKLITYMNGQC